jgi:glycosyltransferase involved in cell wall biosynthesis
MLEYIYARAHKFDILHFHLDYFPNPLFSRQPVPFLTTLHGRLDLPELGVVYRTYPEVPVVSISNSQRKPIPDLNWIGTVYHGITKDQLTPQPVEPSYFAFLGRISPEKGIERAIQIANATGVKLKIAAKVDKADAEYFKAEVEPLLNSPNVEYIGEINDAQKAAFLSGAKATLFAIDWPEPFGLVMIESMACGTPIVAMRRGSVPEVMDDGITGFIVDNVEEAIAACRRIDTLDRAKVRAQFEKRFTSRRMAEDYLALYRRLIDGKSRQLRAVGD